MKKFLSIFILLMAITLVFTKTSVIAVELENSNNLATEYIYGNSFKLLEDGSLWQKNNDNKYVKIYDDVKSITAIDLNFSNYYAIVQNNGTLVFYDDYIKKFYTVDKNVSSVSESATFVIKNDNKLYRNIYDQVNDYEGNVISIITTPQFVMNDVAKIESFEDQRRLKSSLVIKTDGSLWTFETQDNSYLTKFTDVKKLQDKVKDVENCDNITLVLEENGDLYNVNNVKYHEMGKYNFNNKTLIASDVKSIYTNNGETFFILKNDNSLWGKGKNDYRQLGLESDFVEEFTLIANDVNYVSLKGDYTLFVKNDDSIYAMGSNFGGQIGRDYDIETKYFDVNGFREIMKDVSSAEINGDVLTTIKNDNSLWGLGKNDYFNIATIFENEIYTPAKIVDKVKYAYYDERLNFIDETDGLHFRIGEEIIDDDKIEAEVMEYTMALLGRPDITYDEYLKNQDKYDEYFDEVTAKMSDEQQQAILKKISDEFLNSKIEEKQNLVYATDVKASSSNYYLTNSKELYRINRDGKDEVIATNIQSFTEYNKGIFVVDSNEELKYYINNEWYETGIKNVKDVKVSELSSTVLVLTTDNKLWKVYTSFEMDDFIDKLKNNKSFKKDMIATDVISFDAGDGFIMYVTSDGVLWGKGSNIYQQLGNLTAFDDVNTFGFSKIMENVKSVSTDDETTVVVKTDGTLVGMGQNNYGVLGYPSEEDRFTYTFSVPTRVIF